MRSGFSLFPHLLNNTATVSPSTVSSAGFDGQAQDQEAQIFYLAMIGSTVLILSCFLIFLKFISFADRCYAICGPADSDVENLLREAERGESNQNENTTGMRANR